MCKTSTSDDTCVTKAQLITLRRIYAGPTNPDTGEQIYPGLTLGSETQPLGPVEQGDPAIFPPQQFYLFDWAKIGFDPMTFSFGTDLDQVDDQLATTLNANSVDLSEFRRAGGKLLIYTGLADPAVPFTEVSNYYERLTEHGGEDTGDFARLFAIPGMGHCFGGPGATDIGQPFTSQVPQDVSGDALMALVAWTEGADAPDMLIASKPAEGDSPFQQRPICAYPALPEYRHGDAALPSSFTCVRRPVSGKAN